MGGSIELYTTLTLPVSFLPPQPPPRDCCSENGIFTCTDHTHTHTPPVCPHCVCVWATPGRYCFDVSVLSVCVCVCDRSNRGERKSWVVFILFPVEKTPSTGFALDRSSSSLCVCTRASSDSNLPLESLSREFLFLFFLFLQCTWWNIKSYGSWLRLASMGNMVGVV